MNQNENENFNEGDFGEANAFSESAAPAAVKKKKPITVSLPVMIVSVLLAALITFQTTFVVLNIKHTLELTKTKAAINKFQVLLEAYEIFGDKFIYDIDIDELINKMLDSFGAQDKYSSYYTYEEYLQMLLESKGNSQGIGVYITGSATTMMVTFVMPNSPAEAAGLLAGDEIIAIDGNKVADVGYNTAVDLVVGKSGTQRHAFA